jgi:hypothetical protein
MKLTALLHLTLRLRIPWTINSYPACVLMVWCLFKQGKSCLIPIFPGEDFELYLHRLSSNPFYSQLITHCPHHTALHKLTPRPQNTVKVPPSLCTTNKYGMELNFYAFRSQTLDGGEWSALRSVALPTTEGSAHALMEAGSTQEPAWM